MPLVYQLTQFFHEFSFDLKPSTLHRCFQYATYVQSVRLDFGDIFQTNERKANGHKNRVIAIVEFFAEFDFSRRIKFFLKIKHMFLNLYIIM